MNRASVDIAGCDTHTGWTEDDDCPHCLIVASHNLAPEMLRVIEAAKELFDQQSIGNGGCYRPITDCDGLCEHFVICALRPIRAALRDLDDCIRVELAELRRRAGKE